MEKNILVDTGFWFALYEPTDSFHKQAKEMVEFIGKHNILIPWPCFYETINTKFVKRKDYMTAFEAFIDKPNVILIDDNKHKDKALKLVFEYSKIGKRHLSLVDIIMREILSEDSYNVKSLLTFNIGDFVDVCKKRKIRINA